jgi:plasmid rolling circle replication initiator protein Rep
VSESNSDASNSAYASSLPSPTQPDQTPGLADLSEKDKPWDKHRGNADRVSNHYARSPYQKYSERIKDCSELLDFRLVPEQHEGVYKLKLSAVKFCRVRHCPVCQWRRSLMWKAKAYQALPKVIQDYPKHRWLFLTLTVKNCPIQESRKNLDSMNKSFIRLSKLKEFPGVGWIKSVEVTRGRDGNAHPHIHCLLMVAPRYFGPNYLSQQRWTELWQQSARLDYKPMIHVKAIAKHHDSISIIPEILKYQVKESDLVANRAWFLELTKQLHKTRAVAVGGVLRHYMGELEKEPEDLIGKDNQGEVDEGHLYFQWKRENKKYKLLDV